MTEITSKIAVDYFEKIIEFVIHKGARQTYCNKYNHNPHLKCDTLDIYLNPTSQFVNWTTESLSEKISDYNEICISTNNTKIRYYTIKLLGNRVFCDKEDVDFVVNIFLREIKSRM
jgi:hypothetical protein